MICMGLWSRATSATHESIFAALFGHDLYVCEMVIAGGDAIVGYGIAGDASVDVDSDISMEMMRREHAKGLTPLVLTPAMPGSSRNAAEVYAMIWLELKLR